MHQYSPSLISDEDLVDSRKLLTEDIEKLKTLREIHKSFSKDEIEINKVNAQIDKETVNPDKPVPPHLKPSSKS